jgi:hypothetical protein
VRISKVSELSSTIRGYLGSSSDEFAKAMGRFALAYADQVERDHAALKATVKKGKIKVYVAILAGRWSCRRRYRFDLAGLVIVRTFPSWTVLLEIEGAPAMAARIVAKQVPGAKRIIAALQHPQTQAGKSSTVPTRQGPIAMLEDATLTRARLKTPKAAAIGRHSKTRSYRENGSQRIRSRSQRTACARMTIGSAAVAAGSSRLTARLSRMKRRFRVA